MRFTGFRIFLCLALPMVFGFNLGAANRVIRGTLFPAYGETQLPDKMTITLSSQGVLQTAMSWGAGSFSFENVSEGSYVVTVTAPGRQSASAVVEVQGPGSFFVVSVVVGPPIEDSQNSPAPGAAVVDVATLRIPEKAVKAFEEGVSYLNKNEPRKAEELLQRAISEYPHFHHAHNALGIVYTRSKRLKEAREEFTKAVEIKPDSPGAQRNLGLVMLLQNRHRKSTRLQEPPPRHRPPPNRTTLTRDQRSIFTVLPCLIWGMISARSTQPGLT